MLLITIFVFILLGSFLSISTKRVLEGGVSAGSLLLVSSIAGAIFLLPIFVWQGMSVPNSVLLIIVFAGALKLLAAWPITQSVKLSEVSFITQFSSFTILASIFLSGLFLSELPNFYGLVGVGLIILGSVILTKHAPSGHWMKAVWLRLLGSVFIAGSSVLLRANLDQVTQVSAGSIVWLTCAVISLPILPLFLRKYPQQRTAIRNNWSTILLITFLAVVGYLFQIYLLSKFQVGYTFALLELGLLINIIAAGKFLKEKKFVVRLFPATIIITGVLIIYYLGN